MNSLFACHAWFLALVLQVHALSRHGWRSSKAHDEPDWLAAHGEVQHGWHGWRNVKPSSQALDRLASEHDAAHSSSKHATSDAAALNATASYHEQHSDQSPRPHIVFIIADDLGWNDIGLRNGEIQSPNIDDLARRGMLLENYYVQPTCSPTRASFLTGRYPLHHGVGVPIEPNVPLGLPLNETTLASLLRARGYKAHIVGKWHLGSHSFFHTPTFRGFESFYGFYGGSERYFAHTSGNSYDFRRDRQEFCGKGCSEVNVADVDAYSTDLFSHEAARIITTHDQSAPLFLYLSYQAVHFPAEVPDKYGDLYAKIGDESRRIFAGMLTSMDQGIGKVLRALRETDMMRKTVLVFTTDNGAEVLKGGDNYPLNGWKGELLQGGVRGTGLVVAPGVSARKFSGLMHAVDWLPTLLEAAGPSESADRTLPLDGLSMWQAFKGEQDSPRTSIYLGRSYKDSIPMWGPAVLDGDVKLILRGSWPDGSVPTNSSVPPLVLYNLARDPNEKHDLSLEDGATVQRLKGLIESFEKDSGCLSCPDERCPSPRHEHLVPLENGTLLRPLEPFCDDVFRKDLEELSLGARRAMAHLPAVQFMELQRAGGA